MPQLTPAVLTDSSMQRLALQPGQFTLAGAGVDPTVFSGAINKVEALAEGGVPFYRVTFNHHFRNRNHSVQVSAQAIEIADDLTVSFGEFTPDVSPGPFESNQLDVVLRDAGLAIATAGYKIHITVSSKVV